MRILISCDEYKFWSVIVWVGKNAVKELETLVNVEERGRLLTSKSKMGSKYK